MEDMNICYILDGILIIYCISLTVLYIRLKFLPLNRPPTIPEKTGGIYAGLSPHISDTYETIGAEKTKMGSQK